MFQPKTGCKYKSQNTEFHFTTFWNCI